VFQRKYRHRQELLDITLTFKWRVRVEGFKLTISFRNKTRTRDT